MTQHMSLARRACSSVVSIVSFQLISQSKSAVLFPIVLTLARSAENPFYAVHIEIYSTKWIK